MKNTGLATFQTDVLDSDTPIIVDFYSDACPPCKRLMPLLETMENEGLIQVVKVNVEDEMDLAQHLQISSLPTLVLFKNGWPIGRLLGLQTKARILKFYQTN